MMEWIGNKLKQDCHCSPHTPDAFQKIEWEKRGFTQVNGKLGVELLILIGSPVTMIFSLFFMLYSLPKRT